MIHVTRFRIVNQSIVINATVNRKPVEFILDTGDAIGPVLNSADAERVGAPQGEQFGVSGAGGATTSYQTVIDVTFGGITYNNEAAAIDPNLEGPSLLGLPFFVDKSRELAFNWNDGILAMAGV